MGKGKHLLSAVAVKAAKAPCRLSDGHGLYFVARKGGGRSWSYVWIKSGLRREMGLGGIANVSLKQARIKADKIRGQIGAGLDPIAQRDKERTKTFGEAADILLADLQKSWTSELHGRQWKRALNELCEPIRNIPVDEIDTAQVMRVLKPVWLRTPETGRRLRSRIEHVLNFAKSENWRSGDNPAQWKGNIEYKGLPKKKRGEQNHFAAMPYAELPAFMIELRALDSVAVLALEFTILTAARTGETLGARWQEFDLDAALWTIPAERMKTKIEHTVPLTVRVIEILRHLHNLRVSDFVFMGNKPNKPISNMSMTMTLRRMGQGQYTVHGFRATFRTYVSEATTIQREVAEIALSHLVGNEVERSYSRGELLEKRRGLMTLWADYCAGVHSGDVVALHG